MKKILFFLTITFLVFWKLFVPGIKAAPDFPHIYTVTSRQNLELPYTWKEMSGNFGEYGVSTLWSWPVSTLYALGRSLDLDFSILMRLISVYPAIFLSALAAFFVLKHFGLKNWGRFIGSLVYSLNTYFILLIDGGQLGIALAYSWLPIAFLLIEKSTSEWRVRRNLLASLGVVVLGFFDVRFIYVLSIILLLRFSFIILFGKRRKKKVVKNWLVTGVVIAFIYTGFNAYWLLPTFLTKGPTLPPVFERTSQLSFLGFTSLGHSLFLLQPHWYQNVFGKVSAINPEFILIPLLAFMAPILKRKDKNVAFWLLVAIVFIFLTKGSQPPLSSLYTWLFENTPGFSVFRDSSKFFVGIALSYSFLIGLTIQELSGFLKKELFKKTLIVGVIVYLVLLARPAWTGKMTGILSSPPNQTEYFKVADILETDKDFSRVLWIPSRTPLAYALEDKPPIEASRLISMRPFTIGVVGTYETFNFLREAPFMGEIFEIAGIRYIAYPFPDERREELKEDNIAYYNAFLDQLTNLDWIEKRLTEPPVSLLKTREEVEHIFASPNTFFVVGSDRIYWDLVGIEGFDLSDNSLIFTEEQPGLGEILEEIDEETVILFDKKEIDLVATKIDREKFIFPAANLDFDPDETGWWKREAVDLIRWRDFLQQKYQIDNLDFDYGGGWAVSEGQNKLEITDKNIKKGDILLARVMESSRGGVVEFYQGEVKIGEINTKLESPEDVEVKLTGYEDIPDQFFNYDKANVRWFEVGALSEDQSLTIRTEGDINVVNSLIGVDKKRLEELKNTVSNERVILWSELTTNEKEELFSVDNSPQVTYERISPTHYKVDIKGLQESTTIAFSETYDPLWKVDGQNSYPLYSLINGFYIESDGEYDIIFEPQKHVLPGLVVSGITLILVIGTLIILRRKA